MNAISRWTCLASLAVVSACSSFPERIESLEHARATVQRASSMQYVATDATEEITLARNALGRADALVADRADLDLIEHEAYLAERYGQTAIAIADARIAADRLAGLEDERERILLENRERAEQDASIAAARANMRAQSAEERAAMLAAALEELHARETDRGIVLTLGDVLFETDRTDLKPGADATVARLGQFLRDYPDRRVLIEGHTDSVGSDAYNLNLSRQRADAVRAALLMQGIEATRIIAVGKGESFPVASNDTAAGRQENRRVEIVISDAAGRIAGMTEPEAALP